MNRKKFIHLSLVAAGAGGIIAGCRPHRKIGGKIMGASAAIGHRLRDSRFEDVDVSLRKKIVIIGGGVSGLSAGRYLRQQGLDDFLLLELEEAVGGNAAHGTNEVSAFPWGAHYIPTPNNDLAEYIAFLRDCNVITGVDPEGLPIYNEYYLCFDPEERLYINGKWQEGLVPGYGVPDVERKQIEQFLAQMNLFRYQKGSDGLDAFAIPTDRSSKDVGLLELDKLTMRDWMNRSGYDSPTLDQYVNYCTRDDFGTPHDQCSAWAGIHYFASRKGKGLNATHADVLTWPEGNGFLVRHLARDLQHNIVPNALAISVRLDNDLVRIQYLDTKTNKIVAIEAEQCLLAVPQFIAARLLNDEDRQDKVKSAFHYAPWMVANLKVALLEERSGAPPSWDNVMFNSKSLGYVDATHQGLARQIERRNLTYYLPLTGKSPAEERRLALERTHEEWVELIIEDMQIIHPDISKRLEEVNVMIWGHAMIQPLPGVIHGEARKTLGSSLENKIHFAHSDLSGISIFEEAFYQGWEAARKIKAQLTS